MSILPASTEHGVPTSAFLQLSDHCNHACTHCYQVHGERGELSTAEVKDLLDGMAKAGVLFLTLSGGEVTLRPDFLEIIRHARCLGFAVRIFTNAYKLDDELARRLAELAILEAHVSVYSAHAPDHDAVTRVPGSWERTMSGVRALRRHGVRVVLKMPLMQANGSSYRDVMALAQSLGCHYMMDAMIDVREDGDSSCAAVRVPDDVLTRFIEDPDLGFAAAGGHEIPTKPLSEAPCGVCATGCITPNGAVRPCTSLPFELGRVGADDYAAMFRDSPTSRFLRALTWDDLPACRVCDLRRYCSRCHAAALLEDGDMFGPASSACRFARVAYRLATASSPGPDEPKTGPYQVVEGRLETRPYERLDKTVPHDVKWALVQGKTKSVEGEASSRRRVVLRVLNGGPVGQAKDR